MPVLVLCAMAGGDHAQTAGSPDGVRLPPPRHEGAVSVEKALLDRRSVRRFAAESLPLATLSQLAWAAQGVTRKEEAPPGWPAESWHGGKRTAPSAGALYPLEVYLLVGKVENLPRGIYRYRPADHSLVRIAAEDGRRPLADAAFEQDWIAGAPLVFVIGAVQKRTETRYGKRASRYVHIEVGHAVENICLQAVALGLGTTMVGAFDDDRVKKLLGMPAEGIPLAIVPVGKAADR